MSMSMFLIPCVCACVCVVGCLLIKIIGFLEFNYNERGPRRKRKKSGIFYKTTHANTCRAHEPSRFQLHLRLRNTDTIASSGSRVQGVTVGAVLEELSPQEKRKK